VGHGLKAAGHLKGKPETQAHEAQTDPISHVLVVACVSISGDGEAGVPGSLPLDEALT
jgi:hypothetical protein